MKTRSLRRTAVALAAAGALVAMMGSPASATAYNAEITGGTLILTQSGGGGAQNVSLATGAGNCPAGTLTVDINTTPNPDTIEVTALSNKGQFTFSGGTYIAELSLLYSTQGTVSGTTVSNLAIGVNADIYQAGSNCTNGTQVCDDLQTEITLGGSLSSAPPLSSGDTASLTGSDTIALGTASFCNAPFASYLNGHVNITGASPLVAEVI